MSGFEWDQEKAAANIRKHGIDFRDAVRVFGEVHFVYRSEISDEERYVTVGPVNGRIIAVVWTPREGQVRRIISARRARNVEERLYRQSEGG